MHFFLSNSSYVKSTYRVELEFSPHSTERPGLSVFYSHKMIWKHIAKIVDIYAMILERHDVVKLEMGDFPAGFSIQITDPNKMNLFLSAMSGRCYRFEETDVPHCASYVSHTIPFFKISV